jgi:hypothetical protein
MFERMRGESDEMVMGIGMRRDDGGVWFTLEDDV